MNSSRALKIVFLFFVLLSFIQEVAGASTARMPRGSFLRQPAYSAAQLASQIRRDAVVAARYAKHYGIPSARFADYIQSQVGLRRLNETGSYRVYFVKADGTIHSKVRRLRKGTAVFMHLRTGKPVLLAECGNPMSSTLPGYVAPSQAVGPLQEPQVFEPELPVENVVVEEPSLPLDPARATDLLLEEPAGMLAEIPPDIPLWEADNVLSLPDWSPIGHGNTWRLPALKLEPVLLAGIGSNMLWGGSPGLGRGGTQPPAPVIPEPATVWLWLAAGAAGASLARRRWRK